jgi:holo-[acyl-carrier protein] synthase
MIFGVGTDLVRQDRIQQSLDRFGDRFVQRLLLQQELDAFQKQRDPTRFLAMRFAAKEAVVKAMGTGFAHGMWVRDVGTIQNEWGRPEIIYSQRGEAMCRKLGIGEGHISLTDEAGFIVAFAVLMRARD